MCVIITGTTKRPTLTELQAAETQNPDGGGIAWVNRGEAHFRKGLNAQQIHDLLAAVPDTDPWVIHFRFATVGEPSAELCHPFPASHGCDELATSGATPAVLFHNGTVSDWKERVIDSIVDSGDGGHLGGGPWSDSRGVAHIVRTSPLLNPADELDTMPGKYVVLTADGAEVFPRSLTGWHQSGGILYSNLYWRNHLTTGKPKRRRVQGGVQTTFVQSGAGSGRSLVDEAQAIIDEVRGTKSKKRKGRKVRKNLKLRQG